MGEQRVTLRCAELPAGGSFCVYEKLRKVGLVRVRGVGLAVYWRKRTSKPS